MFTAHVLVVSFYCRRLCPDYRRADHGDRRDLEFFPTVVNLLMVSEKLLVALVSPDEDDKGKGRAGLRRCTDSWRLRISVRSRLVGSVCHLKHELAGFKA